VLAAAALAAIIVLAIAIATLRTIDTPATAQPTTAHPTTAHPTAAHPTAAHPTASSAELATWMQTLEALDAQRAQAFWTLDLKALDRIYVPGSAPWRADRALLSAYRNQNVRVQGLRITIESTDHLTAGQAIDRTGAKTPLPPGPPTTRLITLATTQRTAAPSRSATRQPTPAWRITTITHSD
jgi:hypothetical protein